MEREARNTCVLANTMNGKIGKANRSRKLALSALPSLQLNGGPLFPSGDPIEGPAWTGSRSVAEAGPNPNSRFPQAHSPSLLPIWD